MSSSISTLIKKELIKIETEEVSRYNFKSTGKYKIVTLDGQVVNVGGSLTGGAVVKGNNNFDGFGGTFWSQVKLCV